MRTIRLRDVEIGSGSPKVIVPIVGKNRGEILTKAQELTNIPLHVVEWRADFYQDVNDLPSVLSTLRALREALGNIPILFTFRTRKEGGERDFHWVVILSSTWRQPYLETWTLLMWRFSPGTVWCGRISTGSIRRAGSWWVPITIFKEHPARRTCIFRLRKMQDMGADIPKIAVMPRSAGDVLTLLSATEEMARCYADRPIITMSMSPQGVVSRLCGEVFGSSMTFGAVGQVSAPGQIPVDQLRQVLEILHGSL